MTFRFEGEELEVLPNASPPFCALGWGKGAIAMNLDNETDWDEVRELVTDSFCVMAPRNPSPESIDRPPPTSGRLTWQLWSSTAAVVTDGARTVRRSALRYPNALTHDDASRCATTDSNSAHESTSVAPATG